MSGVFPWVLEPRSTHAIDVYAPKKKHLIYKILIKVYASGNNKHKSNKHILFIVYVNYM